MGAAGRDRLTMERSLSLEGAWARLDALSIGLPPETVPLAEASGRVLAQAVACPMDHPDTDRAAADGYPVCAAACDGASAYNPLLLPWRDALAAGTAMPADADAVLPLDLAQRSFEWLEVVAPVAVGTGVDRRGGGFKAREPLFPAGCRLLPQDLGCLAALGLDHVSVLSRPAIRLSVAGPKSGADALTPMLRGLLARDGAGLQPDPEAVWIMAGRSGDGPDDNGAATLLEAGGTLAWQGLAIHPGGTAGFGLMPGGAPVFLLPGHPLDCLAAYDLLAARLIRRLAGLGTALPYPVRALPLGRKIVSGIGLAERIPVRVTGHRAYPMSIDAGLPALLADGFVQVAAGSEGHPEGDTVPVHCYRDAMAEQAR